jgi:hypothetical protein
MWFAGGFGTWCGRDLRNKTVKFQLKKQLLYYGRAHFKHSHIQTVAIFTKGVSPIPTFVSKL